MADSCNVKVVILWADEVRAAARAIGALVDLVKQGKEDADPDATDRAVKAALEASHAALFNREILDGASIVVCEAPLRTVREPRITVEMSSDAARARQQEAKP